MRRIQVQIAVLLTVVALLAGALALIASTASAQQPSLGRSAQVPPPGKEAAQTTRPLTSGAVTAPAVAALPKPAAPNVVLYDQVDNPGANGTNSQQFEAANVGFNNQAADDFSVPLGQNWQVTEVDAQGLYFNGTGPAASFNVFFYSSVPSGTYAIPGAAVYTATAQTYVNTAGLFAITLSSPAVLAGSATNYFVSVQAVQDFTPAGQWGWNDRTVQSNSTAAWRNPNGGFATACNNWDKRTFCVGDPAAPDQMFRLVGTIVAGGTATPTVTGTPPTATRTATASVTATRTATSVGGTQFCNPAPITINDAAPASPYPSNIVVSGAGGSISTIRVRVTGINHTWPDDIDMLLVGPNGGKVLLMSDAGGSNDLVGVNLVFQDGAPLLPDSAQIVSGTYAPTDYEVGTDTFPAPAPAGPYSTSLNTSFVGSNPNGTWSLYIVDDAGADFGNITGGWCLELVAGGTPLPTTTRTATVVTTPTRTGTAGPSPTCSAGGGGTPGPWRTSTATPPERYRAGGTTDGTYIYVYGGSNSTGAYLNDLWRWNPATEAWTQLANMPTGKSNIQGAYWNGKIYVPGGYIGSHITENAIYDLATNTWTTGAALPATQSGQTAAYNGKIYNIGGNPGPQATVSIYDIATNTWSTGAPLPVANTYGRAITVGSYIYYVGGIAAATTNTVYRYDPVGNSWTTMAPLQTARASTELATNGTYIFALGGGDATFFTGVPLPQSVEIYNIATNTWTYGNPLVAKVAAPSGGGVTGGKVMITNGVDSTTYPVTVQVADVSGGAPCASPTAGGTSTATRTATIPAVTASVTSTGVPSNTPTTGTSPTSPPAATRTATVTATVTACPVQFVDVPPSNTFYTYIRCLACRGIVGGYPCGGPGEPCPGNYYRPNNNVTRGQTAKIVSESAGFNNVIPSTQQTFEDVAPGSTFHLWIERLSGRGIIQGYPCGGPFEPCVGPNNRPYFRPGNNVTRGQLSKITSGAAGWTETPTGQTFEDVPVGSTFYVYIERMAARGIIQGYPCGGPFEPCIGPGNRPYFRPNNNATRGQMAKIAAQAFFPNCQTPAAAPLRRSPDTATP